MSTTTLRQIRCPTCDAILDLIVVESANVDRHPAYRDAVLDESFMRFDCATCGLRFRYEQPLLYTDLSAGLFVAVFPSDRRTEATRLEALVDEAYFETSVRNAPGCLREQARLWNHRVVFGYSELREKVLLWQHGLDDQVVEVLKVTMLGRNLAMFPDAQLPEFGLFVIDATDTGLVLRTASSTGGEPGELFELGWEAYDHVAHRRADWIVPLAPLLSNPYVSHRRPIMSRSA